MSTQILHYLTGDATEPQVESGTRIIAHCCNDQGLWGAGFVLALSRKWKEPEHEYRKLGAYPLGHVQMVQVSSDPMTFVANIIGQHGVRNFHSLPPIRYEALRQGFEEIVDQTARATAVSLHVPRIGSGLAGGDWALLEAILEQTFGSTGIPVYVYSLPGQTATNGGWFDSRVAGSYSWKKR